MAGGFFASGDTNLPTYSHRVTAALLKIDKNQEPGLLGDGLRVARPGQPVFDSQGGT